MPEKRLSDAAAGRYSPGPIIAFGGREGIRTPGLLVANEALSQLSYSPTSSRKILAEAEGVANNSRSAILGQFKF
jgi:hypothetical protein